MATDKSDNAKGVLIDGLNGLLADYFTLYLKTKSFHWHVKGPQFHDLHLLFDAQATEIFAVTDLVAERVRKIGGTTLTSIGSVSKKSSLKDEDRTSIEAMDMVKELKADNDSLVATLKGLKDPASEAGDNATDSLLDDWTDQAEMRSWFLREIVA